MDVRECLNKAVIEEFGVDVDDRLIEIKISILETGEENEASRTATVVMHRATYKNDVGNVFDYIHIKAEKYNGQLDASELFMRNGEIIFHRVKEVGK